MNGLAGGSRGLLRLAAALLAMLCAAAALAVAWPGSSRAQEMNSTQAVTETAPEGVMSSLLPPADEAEPEPIRHVEEPTDPSSEGSGSRGEAATTFVSNSSPFASAEIAQATGETEPVFSVYKDFNAWWNENRDSRVLEAMGKTINKNWFTPRVGSCKDGVSPETDVAVFTSNSYGQYSTRQDQNSAGCQAALEAHLQRGKTLIVDMGDNDYTGGFVAPGSKGTPDYVFTGGTTLNNYWQDAYLYPDLRLAPGAKGPDGKVGTGDDHPIVKGPDGTPGTGDDLTETNIDAIYGAAHGNLVDGITLPANAQTLMTADFGGGVQKPILAEYDYAGGHVIVDTLTKEFWGQQPTGYGEPRFMRNLFQYAETLEGGGAEPPAEDPQARNYVAIGDSTTAGHGVRDCELADEKKYYPYGCPVEPVARMNTAVAETAYPDVLAKLLGAPYSDGYKIAQDGDYKAAYYDAEKDAPDFSRSALGPQNAHYNRVGVFGYTVREAVEAYKDQDKPFGADRRDGTPWESQLHAVDDAQKLATISLGANDMDFANYPMWVLEENNGTTQQKADSFIRDLKGEGTTGRDYLSELFAVLEKADDRGAKVLVNNYYNAYSHPWTEGGSNPLSPGTGGRPHCATMHPIGETVTGTINAALEDEVRSANANDGDIRTVDLASVFDPPGVEVTEGGRGVDDHAAGGQYPDQYWVYGYKCDIDEALEEGMPDYQSGADLPNQEIGETVDPHPNPTGSVKMAEEMKRVAEEMDR